MTQEEMQEQIESMIPTPQEIVEHIDKELEEKREQKYKDVCCVIDEIVSEFPESEDEKIRKALIRFHKSTIDVDGIKGEDILAWLEKQKPLNRNVNTIPFLSHYEPKCYQPNGTCTNPLHDCLECPKFSLYRGTYTSTL